MPHGGKRQSGMTLGQWLLRGPSRREVLLTGTIHARVPKLLVVKAERNCRYDNNECCVCGEQGREQRDCSLSRQGNAGKGLHGQRHGQTTTQQQKSTSGPAQHTRSKSTGVARASATPRASGYNTASKAAVTETGPAALEAFTQNYDNYVCIRVSRDKQAQADTGLTEMVPPGITNTTITQAFVGHTSVVTSLGQECDIETESCPLHLTIETRWGPALLPCRFSCSLGEAV